MPCFLFPVSTGTSAKSSDEMTSSLASCYQESTKSEGRSFVGLWLGLKEDTTQNKFDLKNMKKLFHHHNDVNSRTLSRILECAVFERSSGELVRWKQTFNAMNFLPVSVFRFTVSCCQNFASGTMLIFKVSLCKCILRCLISSAKRSAISDLWRTTCGWLYVASFLS